MVGTRNFEIPVDRLAAMKAEVRTTLAAALQHARWLSKRKLATLVGGLASLCLALPFGRF